MCSSGCSQSTQSSRISERLSTSMRDPQQGPITFTLLNRALTLHLHARV
jgi:hypothetical protein